MSQFNLKDEKGQSLVELALSFTVLLFLIGGIVELGMILYTSVSLRDSAQEGVLYASTNPPVNAAGYTQMVNRVTSSASYPINAQQITSIQVECTDPIVSPNLWSCDVTKETSCQGKPITVTISYIYRPVTPLLGMIWPNFPLTVNVTNTILTSEARDKWIEKNGGAKCP